MNSKTNAYIKHYKPFDIEILDNGKVEMTYLKPTTTLTDNLICGSMKHNCIKVDSYDIRISNSPEDFNENSKLLWKCSDKVIPVFSYVAEGDTVTLYCDPVWS